MLFGHRITTAAPMSDRIYLLWVVSDEPTPAAMIGLTLCSVFHIDELALDSGTLLRPESIRHCN